MLTTRPARSGPPPKVPMAFRSLSIIITIIITTIAVRSSFAGTITTIITTIGATITITTITTTASTWRFRAARLRHGALENGPGSSAGPFFVAVHAT